MGRVGNGEKWSELAIGLLVAIAAALGLWSVGLTEVMWAPFVAVAAATSARACGIALKRRTGV